MDEVYRAVRSETSIDELAYIFLKPFVAEDGTPLWQHTYIGEYNGEISVVYNENTLIDVVRNPYKYANGEKIMEVPAIHLKDEMNENGSIEIFEKTANGYGYSNVRKSGDKIALKTYYDLYNALGKPISSLKKGFLNELKNSSSAYQCEYSDKDKYEAFKTHNYLFGKKHLVEANSFVYFMTEEEIILFLRNSLPADRIYISLIEQKQP